ncbi:MAG: AsmA family protein [Leptospira sp.]|nr:AsmA family protein [Leptospira sp.]NCS92316.1 AsmA family protein [Leptospira sp.]
MKLSKTYPYFPFDKRILNRIYFTLVGIIASFFFLLSIILITLQFILDKDLIRGMISKQINESTNFLITYEKVETIIFPLPGIQLTDISVSSSEYSIAKIEKLKIYWNIYALLLKKFELDSLSIESGEVFIIRSEDGSLPAFANTKKEQETVDKIASDTENTPDGILNLLPYEISLQDIKLYYIDQRWLRADQIKIESLRLNTDSSDRQIKVNLDAEINGDRIHLLANNHILENNWDVENIESQIQINFTDIHLNPYNNILSILPDAKFDNSIINLSLDVNKNKDNTIAVALNSFSLKGLESTKNKKIQDISIQTMFQMNLKEQNLSIDKFLYELKDKAKLSLTSELSWKDRIELTSKVNSEKIDLDSTIFWVTLLSKVDNTKSFIITDLQNQNKNLTKDIESKKLISKSNVKSELENEVDSSKNLPPSILVNLDLNKILVANHYIHKLTGKIQGNDEEVKFSNLDIFLYDGKVNVNGKFRPKDSGHNITISVNANGLDMQKLLARVTKDRLLTGKMNAVVNLKSRISEKDSFANWLNIDSNFTIWNGELLGYANFIRPVAEIGKAINFYEGNGGKSTSFKSIKGSVNFQNKVLTLKNFDMEGVGINAEGSGVYTLNGKVNMRFEASLPGIAGKAFKIPILYRGVLGKNIAFIDPVWMASVYVGSILFAGPAGAVIGGLAGSASSEAVQKATDVVSDSYDSAKSFLFGKSKK